MPIEFEASLPVRYRRPVDPARHSARRRALV